MTLIQQEFQGNFILVYVNLLKLKLIRSKDPNYYSELVKTAKLIELFKKESKHKKFELEVKPEFARALMKFNSIRSNLTFI